MKHLLKRVALVSTLMSAASAYATNGYFLPGFGAYSMGMGGVGIGFGVDSISSAANPANLSKTGMRGDLDILAFNPVRSAHVYNAPPAISPKPGNFGTGLGEVDSNRELFPMPNMGFSMPLTPDLFAGVAFVANGGMNTTFKRNFFAQNSNTVPPGGFFSDPDYRSTIGVDLAQLLIPVSIAYKPVEKHTFGASVQMAVQRFAAKGLGAFGAFGISSDENNLTDRGYDWSYGAGVRLGWQGDFLDDKLTLGATWASKTYMTKFSKYRGLFAEHGDFDIPSNFGVGMALHPTKDLTLALDIERILFKAVKSVGNRGPDLNSIPAFLYAQNMLGEDAGMGFGWKDMTVYKLGVNYQVTQALTVRAGYNYGRSPIPNDQLTFNTLAPAVVEKHYSLGFTYKVDDNLRLTGIFMHVPENTQHTCGLALVDCVTIKMHQNVVGVSFGWVLDPGKYD